VFRTFLMVLPAFVLLAVAIYYVAVGWKMGGEAHIGTAGYVAMVLGIIVTFAVAGVLIALLLKRGPGEE